MELCTLALGNKYKPDIVGISSTTQEYSAAIMIAEKVKENDNNILVVIGGHHITALPKHLNIFFFKLKKKV